MKCGYKYCKFGGEVEKENAIKVGNRYWHEECVYEKDMKNEIKEYYYKTFNSKEPIQSVNKAISKYVHEMNYSVDYIMFCLKNKVKKLNSLHGLAYSLSYTPNYEEYMKIIANSTKIEYNIPVNDIFEKKVNKVTTNKSKMWGEYF